MLDLDGPLVLVSADRLDEVLELARFTADRLPESDRPVADALRASIAEIRARAVPEP